MSEQNPPPGDPQDPSGGDEPTNPYQTGSGEDRPSWSTGQQPTDPSQYAGYGQYGQPAQYGQYGGGYGAPVPDHPQSTTVLVLGIVSLVVCSILGPFAWMMGNRVVREIDASRGLMGGRSSANAGRICGIIATVLLGLGPARLRALLRLRHRRGHQLVDVVTERRPRPTPRARPHHRLTDDGRPVREVLSYARRGSRFTPSQQAAWDAHHEAWVIPVEDVDRPGFALADRFGREAPLVVEVGSGVGEATAALAAAHPELDVLALEVWVPGIAAGLARVADAGATNVRFCALDAAWAFEHLLAPGRAGGLLDLLPGPVAEGAPPQAAAGGPGLRDARRRPARARGQPGGWPPTGRTTRR